MSISQRKLLYFLVLGLAILVIWLWFQIEWIEKQVDHGPSAEIKRKQSLAAERFLAEKGTTLIVERGFSRLDVNVENQNEELESSSPQQSGLIALIDGYASLSEKRATSLLEWVQDGGHLVLSAQNPFLSSVEDRTDYIFDFFGVSIAKPDRPLIQEDEPETSHIIHEKVEELPDQVEEIHDTFEPWQPTENCHYRRDIVSFDVHGEIPIELAFDAHRVLNFEESQKEDFYFWAASESGLQIVQVEYGEGFVTFMSDLSLWKNDYIACLDNAYMLQFFGENMGQAWFLINQDSPSLISVAWERFPYFVVILIVLILLSLWHFGQRFGLVTPASSIDRRRMLEHIEAGALFLWRRKPARWDLVAMLQQRIISKMKTRTTHFTHKTHHERNELIAKASKLSLQEVEMAMVEIDEALRTKTLNEASFVLIVKSLKRIEEKL